MDGHLQIGDMQIDGGSGFEAAGLARWCSRHVAGFAGLRGVAKFATGQSNPTFLLTADSGRYVLRTKPPGDLLPSAHQVEREWRVMRALAGTDVPVPRVLAMASDAASPTGRAFYVMEHLDGRILADPGLPGLAPAERAAVYDAMNATLAALHSVDVTAVDLGDYGRPGDYFARQTALWQRQYRVSVTTPSADMARIMDWLPGHLPPDDGAASLVHGDWRIDNLMFAQDRAEVIGVLDWELSTLGPPLADLAYQCMQWRLPHDGPLRGLGGLDRAALGLPDEAAYVAAYARRRGLADVENWAAALVFSFFRLAAILAGVAARAAAGNASNPDTARAYGRAVPVLATLALQVIEEAGHDG